VLLAVGVLLALGVVGGQRYQEFLASPLDVPAGTDHFELEVRPGDPVRSVLERLEARGITRNDWRWRLLLWREPVTIQAGEYAIVAGTGPRELLEQLARGSVIQYRFTIVEGWNWRQLRAELLADERLAVDPERLATDAVMAEIGSDESYPEGWFLPETYAFTSTDDAIDVLARAHAAMQAVLADAWAERLADLPIDSPYELLTLASIVEKESAVAAERPQIAGVFVRRLQQGWRLETDPTVIYGLGERYDGDIRTRDLREDTPYNTYVIRGLPPTPIAMPGGDALRATARPADGTAMFFVADGQGGHVFSETLAEHNRAVQDLLRRQRTGRGNDRPAPASSDDPGTEGKGAS
jgi:UPF0755 protein